MKLVYETGRETGRVSPIKVEPQASEVLHGYEAASIKTSFHTTVPCLVRIPLRGSPRDHGHGRVMNTDLSGGAIRTPLMIDALSREGRGGRGRE